jgi:hypothetical protein
VKALFKIQNSKLVKLVKLVKLRATQEKSPTVLYAYGFVRSDLKRKNSF